jgi:hypothetical protein
MHSTEKSSFYFCAKFILNINQLSLTDQTLDMGISYYNLIVLRGQAAGLVSVRSWVPQKPTEHRNQSCGSIALFLLFVFKAITIIKRVNLTAGSSPAFRQVQWPPQVTLGILARTL